jgi:hypothetical protein
MRKSVRRALGLGLLSGAAYAAWRAWHARMPDRSTGGIEWSSAPFPFPPVPRAVSEAPAAAPAPGSAALAWVEPNADGSCPDSHPIKAKLSSGIFHVPGGANYARTHPDRCYRDADAAIADGLRPAKA